MKNVTQNFINDIKTYGRQFDFNVAINNESISNDNINYIKPAFYTSNENNKTALFTTIMQQLKIDTKNELAINSKIEIEAGIKVNESNYQYISYNPYTVSSCEKQEDTNSYVSLAYDKMIESMIDYDLELSEKITVRNYLILICNRLGWSTEHIPSTFINHNKLVDPALHQGINYTFRMALDEIATITCSFLLFKGEDFYLIYPTETNQIIDSSFLDEDNVNIGERYFINSLVFSRAEGSDNIYRKDNESVENNGLHEFKISNNQLLSTNDRDIYIDQMFNYLKTFEFYTFDVQSKGILFLEACDRFTFNLSGNTYSTILLNNEQEFEDGLIEKLYIDRPEETETEYKYADEIDKRINQTYLIVDKQNQKIESLVQETVETKVNNMQIGGTNLLRGTNTVTALTSPGTWSRGTWRQAGTGTGERTSINVSDSPNANIKVGWSTTSTSGQVLICQDNVPTTEGEVYTISCYAKGTGKITLQYGNETLNYITSMQTITDENNWKKYSYTFTSRGTANAYFGSGNTNNNVSFCGLKIEKGNIATDWAPAPEDIESNLQNNYYTKTQTESKIEQKADSITSTVSQNYSTKAETTQAKNEAINSANTSTDNKLANYSTTTQMNSTITQKANEITSTVSTIEDKLDNIQVGGTNLLRGTNTVTTLGSSSAWSNGTWRNAGAGTGTRTSISVSDAPNANIKVGWSTSSTSGQVLISQDNVPMTNGEKYTLSCYAKGTGSILLQYGNGTVGYMTSNVQITEANNWKKYSYTFTSKGTANIYIGSNSAENDVSFCGIKLEKGNMATDWSPAPEDIESNLSTNYYTKTETNSQITQKASEIVSTVNETINNIQTGSENLLINTAIKENTNNWSLASGITRTTDKTTPNGNYCFYYNISGVTSNSWRCANPEYVAVQPGEILTADVNVFIPSSNDIDGEVALEIQYFNSSRTRIGYLKKLIDTTVVDKWQKATVTLEAPTNTAYANARVWVLKNGKFYVGDLMLSRGNTSTSWTPSSKDYSTTTEMNSAITQKANEISSVVSRRISAVQIGGTNLIKNSAPYNLNNWVDFDTTLSLANESSAPFSKAIKVHFADTSGTGAFNSIEKRLEVGKEYSWSVYIKASKSTELTVGQEQGGTKVVNLTTSWQKFIHTFTATNEPFNSFVFYCYSNARQNGLDIYIHSLKLEEGNKITSWSVNPNDEVTEYNVISKINQSAEAVQINANKISLVGKQINLTGDNTTITSNNFSVDVNGNMSCSNANITGGEINLSSTEATPKIKITNPNNANSYAELFSTGIKYYYDNQLKLWLSSLVPSLTLHDNDSGHITLFPGALIIADEYNNELIAMNTSDNNGNITCVSLTQTSKAESKKNFEKLENALNIIKATDIYKYNLKGQKDGEKKHIGFVIGEDFKYSKEITSEKNDGVDTYSMVSVLWRAVQEQQEIIEDLKSRIEKLEKK